MIINWFIFYLKKEKKKEEDFLLLSIYLEMFIKQTFEQLVLNVLGTTRQRFDELLAMHFEHANAHYFFRIVRDLFDETLIALELFLAFAKRMLLSKKLFQVLFGFFVYQRYVFVIGLAVLHRSFALFGHYTSHVLLVIVYDIRQDYGRETTWRIFSKTSLMLYLFIFFIHFKRPLIKLFFVQIKN